MKETVLAITLTLCACVGTAGNAQIEDPEEDACQDHEYTDPHTCDDACDEGNEGYDNICYRCGSTPLGCYDLRCDCVVCYNEDDCTNGMRWECEDPGFSC